MNTLIHPRHPWIGWLLMLVVAACQNNDPEETAATELPVVTVFYAPNALGDGTYNDSICAGVYRARAAHPFRLHTIVPQSATEADSLLDDWLRAYPQTTGRHLLVLACEDYEEPADKYADRLPNDERGHTLLFESRRTDLPVTTFHLSLYGASYEAGQLAALASPSPGSTLILRANGYSDLLREAADGFAEGYCDATRTLPDSLTLSDNEKGYFMADELYSMAPLLARQYDFVYPLAGGSIQGLVSYLHTNEGFYMAGMDAYLNFHSLDILFSVVKHIRSTVEEHLIRWLEGETEPAHTVYTFDTGRIEIPVSPFYPELSERQTTLHPLAIEKEQAYENRVH